MAYDAKAIKLPKQVKRSAAAYTNPHERGAFIRSFVRMLENESARGNSRKERDGK